MRTQLSKAWHDEWRGMQPYHDRGDVAFGHHQSHKGDHVAQLPEGPGRLSLGTWRTHSIVGAVLLIGAVWVAAGGNVTTTNAQPPQPQQAVSDTIRLARHLCAAFDADSVMSDSARFGRYRRDCLLRASRIAQLRAENLLDLHWSIQEYHDQQRLRSETGTAFGPVASIYAVPQIGGYEHLHQFDAHGTRGALVAYLVVDAPSPLPSSYTRLNLQVGVNCVWLAHAGANATTGWSGYVTPASAQNTCERSGPLPAKLDVHRGKPAPSSIKHPVPAAARFGEGTLPDPGSGGTFVQPLLGVPCLNAWCEMGPAGFSDGSEVPASAFQSLGSGAREREIKGWYDDQWLSDDVTHQPLLRAAMIPQMNIEKHGASDFEDPRGVHVATIYLFASPPAGSGLDRWGLKAGRNFIYVKVSGGVWESYLTWPGSGSAKKNWKVDRNEHYDEVVPGTARFHWSDSPNSGCTPCGLACCEERGDS
jgi:hypothetical protein